MSLPAPANTDNSAGPALASAWATPSPNEPIRIVTVAVTSTTPSGPSEQDSRLAPLARAISSALEQAASDPYKA